MSVTFLTNEDPIVRYDNQSLTEGQKAQARENIGAADAETVATEQYVAEEIAKAQLAGGGGTTEIKTRTLTADDFAVGYITKTGEDRDASTYPNRIYTPEYLECTQEEAYSIANVNQTAYIYIRYYNAEKECIGYYDQTRVSTDNVVTGKDSDGTTPLCTSPNDVAYVRFVLVYKNSTDVLTDIADLASRYTISRTWEETTPAIDTSLFAMQSDLHAMNPLYGKKAVFDGDSICHGVSGNDGKSGWAGRIGVANEMNWHNVGMSGGTITSGLQNAAGDNRHWISANIDTIYSNHPDLDYLILEGGTNDADVLGVDNLGEISTTSMLHTDFDPTANFTQALEYLLSKAIALYPTKRIGFIVAPKMGTTPTNWSTGKRRVFFDRCVEVCKKYGIPCLDLWYTCHLNPTIDKASHGDAYYMYTDGQHLSAAGYDYVSDIIEAWMKTI